MKLISQLNNGPDRTHWTISDGQIFATLWFTAMEEYIRTGRTSAPLVRMSFNEEKAMIEYDKDTATMDIYCDGRDGDECDEVATYYGTWQECIEQAKKDGWITFKDENGDWIHRCENCKRPRTDEIFKD